MNAADYIVLLLVAALVCFALHLMRSRKKNGSSCCGGGSGGGCSGCGSCSLCSARKGGSTEAESRCRSCRKQKK